MVMTDQEYAKFWDEFYAPHMDIPPPEVIDYQQIVIHKFNQITSVGFTIDEFQKAMVFICLIRFFF